MIALKELKLKEEVEVSIININNIDIEIKQYLDIRDKLSIVNIAMQESVDGNGLVVRPLAEALMTLYIVYLYTNIVFSPNEKDSPIDTYNLLEKNGVIDIVISAIPSVEYDSLVEAFNDSMEDHMRYKTSSASAISEIFQALPNMIDAMSTGLENFDMSKLDTLNGVMESMGGNENAVKEMLVGQK